jgi:ADP-ribose pyrophosphatase
MRTVLPPKARLVPPSAKRVFEGIIFDVYHWQQPAFDGTPITFEMLKRPDTVGIIAVRDGKLVVLEERHAEIPEPFLNFPGGRHDRKQETELEAAKRELAEETGLTFKTWKLIDVRQVESKIEHFVYYFVATDFDGETRTHPDAPERTKVKLMAYEDVRKISNSPRLRFFQEVLFNRAATLEELLNLPEYQP